MGEELNSWLEGMLKETGWSVRELARRAEVSQSYTSRVLSGKQEPGAKFYRGIAKAFDLAVSEVERLDREGVEPDSISDAPITLREAWQILKGLDPEKQNDLLRYARYLNTLPSLESDDADDAQDADI